MNEWEEEGLKSSIMALRISKAQRFVAGRPFFLMYERGIKIYSVLSFQMKPCTKEKTNAFLFGVFVLLNQKMFDELGPFYLSCIDVSITNEACHWMRFVMWPEIDLPVPILWPVQSQELIPSRLQAPPSHHDQHFNGVSNFFLVNSSRANTAIAPILIVNFISLIDLEIPVSIDYVMDLILSIAAYKVKELLRSGW